MLFKNKHTRLCSYCRHCTEIGDAQMLCVKRGVVPAEYSCRKFSYDPCKRIPPRPKALDTAQYNPEDFSL